MIAGVGIGMLIVAGMWLIDRMAYAKELATWMAANNRLRMMLAASAGRGRTPC